MAYIQSGAGTDLLSVGVTNKAARVQLFDGGGLALSPNANCYMHAWNSAISAAATPGAGSSLFHIRNGGSSTVSCYIRQVRLEIMSLAAATTPQLVDLELIRTTVADMSGGTAVTAANIGRKLSTTGNPQISDFRHSTAMAALTTTSVVFGTQLATIVRSSLASTATIHEFDFTASGPVVLRPGEGLAIRNITGIGAAMTWTMKGHIEWDEV
jgi:hypothetical protein